MLVDMIDSRNRYDYLPKNKQYSYKEQVTKDNHIYESLIDNNTEEPSKTSVYWKKLI